MADDLKPIDPDARPANCGRGFTDGGPLCLDPRCYRNGPHYPGEYGCMWSDVRVYKSEEDNHR